MMLETPKNKICNKCGINYPLEDFYTSKTSKDGKRGDCKYCNNKTTRQYHTENKEAIDLLKKRKITTICCYQISDACEKEYTINEYEYNKNLRHNDEKYRCIKCAAVLTHLNKNKKYHTNWDFFSCIDTEIKAYLLGIIAGDGHISKNYQVLEIVANNQDLSTLELFRSYISPDNIVKSHSSSENCSKILICSVSICKDICRHLMIKSGKKSDKIILPSLPEDLMFHFIRGLLDSDGWVKELKIDDRGRKCFYSSTSVKILQQIQELLKNIGIKLNPINPVSSNKYRNYIHNQWN